MDRDDSLPPFLYGAFDWRVDGYHWSGVPAVDLRSDQALQADSPWVVIASVVEHARAGEHDAASRLIPFFTRSEPFALQRIALLVFADLAPGHLLGRLADALGHDDPHVRKYAGEASKYAGRLSLVPPMLRAWQRAETLGDHETIGFAISEMLETSYGPIAEAVGIYNTPLDVPLPTPALARLFELRKVMEADLDPPPLPGLVEETHRLLEQQYDPEAYVWRGEPMSVPAVARALLDAAADSPVVGAIVPLRHRLEAMTGIDCRNFLYAMRPRPKQIQRVVEAFLDSDAPSRYLPGTRYFFGKPIPE
jgi:hypothetical protein